VAEEKVKKKMGRPTAGIDKKVFENLCAIQCTQDEVCAVFGGIDPSTLNRWCKKEYGKTFAVIHKEKKDIGKISIRRSQFKMAQENPTMSIWWGKNNLGQADSPAQVQVKVDDGFLKALSASAGEVWEGYEEQPQSGAEDEPDEGDDE
jgi:hypothetical protein